MEVLIQEAISSIRNELVCQYDMTNDKLANLRQELDSRDTQIRTLLETQQELTHTIQNLQAQMFELARLALLSAAAAEPKPATAPLVEVPALSKRRKGLADMLRILLGHDRGR